ncbi:retrovirus-related Pol polyprotein from transposon 412 [Trichonephila clavipes]|nr:retrovirus-related Pol polyprotein from transposon 412 [Trichonephila clavipes]
MKTLQKVCERLFRNNVQSDVEKCCLTCDPCAARKGTRKRTRGRLQLFNVGSPFERIAFGILGPHLRSSDDNNNILVVMDYFTKWPEAYILFPTKRPHLLQRSSVQPATRCKLAPEEYIEKLQAIMEEMHHLARERIGMASEKMKARNDARAPGHDFHERDKVWLWNPKRRKGLSPKLQTNWEAPYTVLKRLNDVVVRIQKQPHSKTKGIKDMSFTRRPGSGRLRQTSRREDCHIARNARLQPTASFAALQVQRRTAPTAGVMVWDAIAYNTRSLLVLIRGTMTAQRYVHDIMQRLPRAIFQQDNAQPHTARMSQDCLHTVTILPWPI